MTDITLLGLRISVYTRIVRLAMAEKKIDYEFQEVDIFADGGPPDDYLAFNPFGTIPCLIRADFVLYESAAINRYLDDAHGGYKLQPDDVFERARMNQIISVLDCYTYRPMVWDVYVQRIVKPETGEQVDEAVITSALAKLQTVLRQLDYWCQKTDFLISNRVTLADLHAYPMLRYFIDTEDGAEAFGSFPSLRRWLTRMQTRASVAATRYHPESGT